MAVLITGGTGFVGMNIAEELTKRGKHVVILARKPLLKEAHEALKKNPGTYQYVQADITDGEQLSQIIETHKVKDIIHAAVITPNPERERNSSKTIINVNYLGTVEILEAAKKNNVHKLIYLSSASVYGDAAFDDPLLMEESTAPRPRTLYAISKFAGERTALRYKELFNMNITVARVGAVFGPWERFTGVRDTLSGPFQATRLAYLGQDVRLPRKGPSDWVYSREIANSIAAILEKDSLDTDVINLSSGKHWTVDDWCKKLKRVLPNFHFEIAGEPELANVDFHVGKDRSPLSVQRLIRDVGYTPQFGLEESFSDYIHWIDSQPKFWLDENGIGKG